MLARIGFTVAAALLAAGPCAAQSIAWRSTEFAPFQDEDGDAVPLYFQRNRGAAEMMRADQGVPGFVIGSRGSPGYGFTYFYPSVIKLAARDGRLLWTWQPDASVPQRGQLGQAIADAAGDVIVTGDIDTDPGHTFFVAKLRGDTGALRWRVDGATGESGYGVGVDANDDVFVTSFASAGQIVRKFDADGNPLWSRTLPGGNDTWDDLSLVVDAAGDAVVVGGHRDGAFGGIRVAKVRGADGEVAWTHQITSTTYFGAAGALRVLASGDILVAGVRALTLVAGDDGHERWGREPADDVAIEDMVEDAQGRVFLAQVVWPDRPSTNVAPGVAQLDLATGADLWRARPLPDGVQGASATIAIGRDGSLLLGVEADQVAAADAVQAFALDPVDGSVRWRASFGSNDPESGQGIAAIDQAEDGSVFVAAWGSDVGQGDSMALAKLTGPFADDVFANGFDR